MFTENGPFRIESAPARDYLIAAEDSWVETSPVLYIDQPFGTGFSPPSKSNITQGVPFATTEAQIAEAAEAALLAFFEKHPVYAGRPFYIFGESFAGHMAPNIASKIIKSSTDAADAAAAAADAAAAAAADAAAAAAADAAAAAAVDANQAGGVAMGYPSSKNSSLSPSSSSSSYPINLRGLAIGDGYVYVKIIDDSSTSFLVNSRTNKQTTLIGCADPL